MASSSDKTATVTIDLTPQGCTPKPATVGAGQVQFKVTNTGAGSVSEAELRTSDLAKILGEQENLTPGLSGAFTLDLQPGSYKINCPGASQPHWNLTVTGKADGPSWQANTQLTAAVQGYSGYGSITSGSNRWPRYGAAWKPTSTAGGRTRSRWHRSLSASTGSNSCSGRTRP